MLRARVAVGPAHRARSAAAARMLVNGVNHTLEHTAIQEFGKKSELFLNWLFFKL